MKSKLTDKQTRSYSYLSRYSAFPYYYNTYDKKYIYGVTKQMSHNASYSDYTVAKTDTLEKIALKFYGSPELYWILADFNDINDPFEKLYNKYKVIKIPSMSEISWSNGRK